MYLQELKRDAVFFSPERRVFPERIRLIVDSCHITSADIDVIVGSYGQPRQAAAVVENVRLLERESRVHFIVVETSRNPLCAALLPRGPDVSRIWVADRIATVQPRGGNPRYGSYGAALTVGVASAVEKASRQIMLHADMMGCCPSFLSRLVDIAHEGYRLAAFTQRHVFPFSGGMLFEASHFRELGVDWLPAQRASLERIPGLQSVARKVDSLSWLDCGERLVVSTLEAGERAFVLGSRGGTGDYWRHPLADCNGLLEELATLEGLEYGSTGIDRAAFALAHPELAVAGRQAWRKSFDSEGRLVFIHRGRGVRGGVRNLDERGDFSTYLRAFNRATRQQRGKAATRGSNLDACHASRPESPVEDGVHVSSARRTG